MAHLQSACHHGDLQEVEDLVDLDRTSVNEPAPGGQLPLETAARCGHLNIVTFLLDNGAQVDKPSRGPSINSTPLQSAINHGRTEVADLLLQRGADPALLDASGETPLIHAARKGLPDLVVSILRHGGGADEIIDARSKDTGRTALALLMATWNWSIEAIKLLLANGADPTLRDNEGLDAFDVAKIYDENRWCDHPPCVPVLEVRAWTEDLLWLSSVAPLSRVLLSGRDAGIFDVSGSHPLRLSGHVLSGVGSAISAGEALEALR